MDDIGEDAASTTGLISVQQLLEIIDLKNAMIKGLQGRLDLALSQLQSTREECEARQRENDGNRILIEEKINSLKSSAISKVNENESLVAELAESKSKCAALEKELKKRDEAAAYRVSKTKLLKMQKEYINRKTMQS